MQTALDPPGIVSATRSRVTPLYHRALDTLLRVDPAGALNAGLPTMESANDIAAELLAAIRMMKAEAIDNASGTVDYKLLRKSDAYARYRACSARLIEFQPRQLETREQKLAFWINLYNALIIDAVIAFSPGRSVRNDLGFFRRAAYIVGGLRYSADDIEHGILRGNRRHFHPAIWFPQFAADDQRLLQTVRPPDPRVHFALVCGARSCPPFDTFEPDRLDAQLDIAAGQFINGSTSAVETHSTAVSLSPIFKWYRRDFDHSGGVVEFILRYLEPGPARDHLQSSRRRVRYQRFNWTLNRTARTREDILATSSSE